MQSAALTKPAPMMMNEVDVHQLMETIAAVKADPSLGQFQFRAANLWMGGGQNRSAVHGFHGAGQEDATRIKPFLLFADEPPVLLGEDTAPNPVEFVLHALAACMTTTMAYHAAARGIAIQSIDSQLEGDLDLRGFLGLAPVRKGYHAMRVRMRVKTKADRETLAELVKFSPVHDLVSSALPLEVAIETY